MTYPNSAVAVTMNHVRLFAGIIAIISGVERDFATRSFVMVKIEHSFGWISLLSLVRVFVTK